MKKENCTKGPVKISPYCPTNVCNEAQDRHIAATGHAARTPQTDEDKANAELIAEAFNVLHETGMTPRELAKMVAELHAALSTSNEWLEGALLDEPEDFDNTELNDAVAANMAALSKYQPKTPA